MFKLDLEKGEESAIKLSNLLDLEKAINFQKNIYFCFTDYAKTFDCVDHNKLWKILKEVRVPVYLICLLRNLYACQKANIRKEFGKRTSSKLGKEYVKTVYCHPCLLNLYAVYIVQNARLHEAQAGIKIAGRNIDNLRYADDTNIMAESREELKSLLMNMKEESENIGFKLSIQKTQIMTSSFITSWQIEGETMETVRDFIFLGSKITEDGDCSHEIKRRLLL